MHSAMNVFKDMLLSSSLALYLRQCWGALYSRFGALSTWSPCVEEMGVQTCQEQNNSEVCGRNAECL